MQRRCFFDMTENSQPGPRRRYLRSQCWASGVILWASLNGGGSQNGVMVDGVGVGVALSPIRLNWM